MHHSWPFVHGFVPLHLNAPTRNKKKSRKWNVGIKNTRWCSVLHPIFSIYSNLTCGFSQQNCSSKTLCFSGFYMFIETNAPRQFQNNAYLRTAAQYSNDGRAKCLHLWYNAYGLGIGTLRISTGDINGFNKNTLTEIPSMLTTTVSRWYWFCKLCWFCIK